MEKRKIRGVTFSIPQYVNYRGNRYMLLSGYAFRKDADKKAKELRNRSIRVIIRKKTKTRPSDKKKIDVYLVYRRLD